MSTPTPTPRHLVMQDALLEQLQVHEREWHDWERWATEVLTDFKIPFDNHKAGMRLGITQWMADKLHCPDQGANGRLIAFAKSVEAVQPKVMAMLSGNGFVFDSIGADPGNWQHLAFTLYTELCELNTNARAVLDAAESQTAEEDLKTPRTDEAAKGSEYKQPQFCDEWVRADFAREIERELNEAKAELEIAQTKLDTTIRLLACVTPKMAIHDMATNVIDQLTASQQSNRELAEALRGFLTQYDDAELSASDEMILDMTQARAALARFDKEQP